MCVRLEDVCSATTSSKRTQFQKGALAFAVVLDGESRWLIVCCDAMANVHTLACQKDHACLPTAYIFKEGDLSMICWYDTYIKTRTDNFSSRNIETTVCIDFPQNLTSTIVVAGVAVKQGKVAVGS